MLSQYTKNTPSYTNLNKLTYISADNYLQLNVPIYNNSNKIVDCKIRMTLNNNFKYIAAYSESVANGYIYSQNTFGIYLYDNYGRYMHKYVIIKLEDTECSVSNAFGIKILQLNIDSNSTDSLQNEHMRSSYEESGDSKSYVKSYSSSYEYHN